jgi:adenylosuccinate synthase
MPGWKSSTVGVQSWDALPTNAQRYLRRVSEAAGVPIDMVSTGPDRVDTILLRDPFNP